MIDQDNSSLQFNKASSQFDFSLDSEGLACVEWNQVSNTFNLISQDFIEDLTLLMDKLVAPEVKAFVFFSGKKHSFCAGADLKELKPKILAQDLSETIKESEMDARFRGHDGAGGKGGVARLDGVGGKDGVAGQDRVARKGGVARQDGVGGKDRVARLDGVAKQDGVGRNDGASTGDELKALADKIERVQELFGQFEKLKIPKIVAIEGIGLGGGLEWALCFDKILISDSAILGLPEVQLGLIPAFGAGMRLPKKIGWLKALPLITGGKTISAQKAYQLALADEKVPSLLLKSRARELAMKLAQELASKGFAEKARKKLRKNSFKRSYRQSHPFLYALEILMIPVLSFTAKNRILKKTKGFYPAPLKALETLKFYRSKKILKREKQAFIELYQSPSTQNLLSLFFLSEQAKKKLQIPLPPKAKTSISTEISKSTDSAGQALPQKSFREIHRVGIFGAGVMGRSISMLLIDKGFEVRLIDPNKKALSLAFKQLEDFLEQQEQKKRISLPVKEQKRSLFSVSDKAWGLKSLDLVIEAIPEDLPSKQELMSGVLKNFEGYLACNSSSLSLSELSQHSPKPENFFGLHFFNPAPKIPLVEVCLNEKQKQNPALLHFLKKIEKIPLFVKDSPGFIVNRLLLSFLMESLILFQEGWPAPSLDQVFKKDWGFPLGPFELMDHIGIDLCLQVQSHLEKASVFVKKADCFDNLVEVLGRGKKEQKGWYLYDKNPPVINPQSVKLARVKKSGL